MKAALLSFVLLVVADLSVAGTKEDAAMIPKFQSDLKELDAAIAKEPGNLNLYSRRGDLHFFLADFEKSVADYRKMIEIDPRVEDNHWRLGLAYYLNGDFEKAAAQFEKDFKFDDIDRENGLWHMLARAGIDGIGSAQLQMLRYSKPDPREPMNALYDLYGGVIKTEEFFRGIQQKGLMTDPKVMFYARLYAGIFEDLSGNREQAKKFLGMAANSDWGRKATGGPGYMWQIARILNEAVNAPADPAAAPSPAEPTSSAEKK
jgi:tetratricopeptide (TPR) repeat protein